MPSPSITRRSLNAPVLPITRSGSPSSLKSPADTETGPLPTCIWVAVPNPPDPLFNSTEMFSEPLLAVTRSGAPSPLKSDDAIELGWVPTEYAAAGPKSGTVHATGVTVGVAVGSPQVLRRTATAPVPALGATRSGLPSSLTSPAVTE